MLSARDMQPMWWITGLPGVWPSLPRYGEGGLWHYQPKVHHDDPRRWRHHRSGLLKNVTAWNWISMITHHAGPAFFLTFTGKYCSETWGFKERALRCIWCCHHDGVDRWGAVFHHAADVPGERWSCKGLPLVKVSVANWKITILLRSMPINYKSTISMVMFNTYVEFPEGSRG